MLIGVVGDVHGNLEALRAVLDRLDALEVRRLLCVGDVVGYGANPRECLAELRARTSDFVAGNHDLGAVGKVPLDFFNGAARAALEWTAPLLSDPEKQFLAQLPLVQETEHCALVHGSFHHPETFPYLFRLADAAANFADQPAPVAFFGHTHIPGAFLDADPPAFNSQSLVRIDPAVRSIFNCGSVGQPRDGYPEASFAVFDTDASCVQFHRVPYDIRTAADKILAAGLPAFLAQRLTLGY